jgi:O-antigen ligase
VTIPFLKTNVGKDLLPPIAISVWSAAAALAPNPWIKLALVAPAIIAAIVWWSLLRPHRWLGLFFVCLLLTPPLPLPLGDSGVHTAPVFAALGLVFGLVRLDEWRSRMSPLMLVFAIFLAVLTVSLSFAALYSGPELALHSLLRVGLFAISVYVFLWTVAGPREATANPLNFARLLFWLAVISALFACADFYFQFPAPAGFEEQFVWLDDAVLRRAQGLFYEASTLGNFCAFFLVMTVVGLFRPRNEAPCSRIVFTAGGLLFATALILSYSRASIVAVLTACAALVYVRRLRMWRAIAGICAALAIAAAAVLFALPSFAANYWNRIVTSFEGITITPDGVLTGRLATWSALGSFLASQPWHAVFGIGYKTLPYTKFAGTEIIADNTYLSVLVETGLIGLTTFIVLNFLILRSGLRAARSGNKTAAFLGEWIFCFWAGEMVQMLSGDLITYWRVLPVYFWVLGAAIREAEEVR